MKLLNLYRSQELGVEIIKNGFFISSFVFFKKKFSFSCNKRKNKKKKQTKKEKIKKEKRKKRRKVRDDLENFFILLKDGLRSYPRNVRFRLCRPMELL